MKKVKKAFLLSILCLSILIGTMTSNVFFASANELSNEEFEVYLEVEPNNLNVSETPENVGAFLAGALAGGLVYDAVKAGYNWLYEYSTPGRQALASANVPRGYKGASLPIEEEENYFGR